MFHWIWHHKWTELEGVVGTECNSRTWDAEPGRSWVWSQPRLHGGILQTELSFFGKAKVLLCIETSWPFPTRREPSFVLSAQGFASTYATCTFPARPPWLRGFSQYTLFLHPFFVLPQSLPSVLKFLHFHLQEFRINVSSIGKVAGEVLSSELQWLAGCVKVELVSLSI